MPLRTNEMDFPRSCGIGCARLEGHSSPIEEGESAMKVTTVGLDLAKQAFSVHGVDEHGKAVLRKRVSRGKLLELFARLPPALVGMEACSGAHHWGRELERIIPTESSNARSMLFCGPSTCCWTQDAGGQRRFWRSTKGEPPDSQLPPGPPLGAPSRSGRDCPGSR